MSDTPYCIEGCGQPAVAERLSGLSGDGDEVVELVCYDHAGAPIGGEQG